MNKSQLNQTENQLPSATDGHVFKTKNFIGYTNYTLFLKEAKGGERICDFGCGVGALLELHYRNKLGTGSYIGLDNSQAIIDNNKKVWANVPWASFDYVDLSTGGDDYGIFLSMEADKVISLNLPTGISGEGFYFYLQNFYLCGNAEATYYIKLPVATSLITTEDIQLFISTYFIIEQRFGVAGTHGDFKHLMSDAQKEMYEGLLVYYNDELATAFMANLFPDQCQQNLYVLKRKQ